MDDEWSILRLDFSKGFRENAILWMIGNYIKIVEREVVIKSNKITVNSIKGMMKQRKENSLYQALPYLSPINGIDHEPQGIG